MDLQTQLKEAAEALNAAYDKFNIASTPEEQDALWHEIQAARLRIDRIVRDAKEVEST